MSLITRLFSTLTPSDPLAAARRARMHALAAHDRAKARGDKRAMHHTQKALKDATHKLMRAENDR